MKRELIFSQNKIIRAAFFVLSLIYLTLNRLKYWFFRTAFRTECDDLFIISIGNITAGGTGKTPFCIELAHMLERKGFRTAVLFRAYQSSEQYGCVFDGETFRMNAEQAGDEPVMIAEKTGVPVFIARKRVKMLSEIRKKADILIMDDGFQYYRLKRDVDIVCIDGAEMFYNRKVLPAGILREPLSALERADIFMMKNSSLVKDQDDLRLVRDKAPTFSMEYIPDLTDIPSGKYIALAGIAKNTQFFDLLENTFTECSFEYMSFDDHWQYTEEDISDIENMVKKTGSLGVICTEKDGIKLRGKISSLITVPVRLHIEERDRLEKLIHEMYNRWRSQRDRT